MRNFMIIGASLLAAIVFFSKSETGSATPPPKPTEAIFVLFENGGTVAMEEQQDAHDTMMHLLHQITKLDRRKATRDVQVYIVLSALPNRIAWSGTPKQMLEQKEDVEALLTFSKSFSDLVMAFEQIKTTSELMGVDRIKLYWLGPTVHVPFQNASNEIVVKVPQVVPPELALSAIAPKLETLKIYRVHPDQDPMLNSYLMTLGILKRAREGTLRFGLYGAAQTNSNLFRLL